MRWNLGHTTPLFKRCLRFHTAYSRKLRKEYWSAQLQELEKDKEKKQYFNWSIERYHHGTKVNISSQKH